MIRVSCRVAFVVVFFAMLGFRPLSAQDETIKVGVIGLDTSHATAFTKILNNPKVEGDLAGFRVVAAYARGSRDIESSVKRVPKYIEDMRSMGVEIVESIPALLAKVDVILLESNDGRPHLEQLLPVLKARKPVFVDKPLAGSLSDALAIYELARKYEVPLFTSSSLRYMKSAQEIRAGSAGQVIGANVYSPASLEPTHPDLFWYGIHGVETLFTVMKAGCTSVSRTTSPGTDVVTGLWSDGRMGVFRGLRTGSRGYGGTAYGTTRIAPIGPYGGYQPLIVEIARFFRSGSKPVSDAESTEIYAFMEAADESKRRGGVPVTLAEVIEAATYTLADGVVYDASYPGGNIIVEGVDGDRVRVRQDLRDTERWWFYWNFRLRGAAGRELTFEFPGESPIGVRGPAASFDEGRTWKWLGAGVVDESRFMVSVPGDAGTLRLAFCIPYVGDDLRRLTSSLGTNEHFRSETLTSSRKHRSVEKLRFGKVDGEPKYRVLLSARHHACESMANYVLEGVILEVLGDQESGRWMRANVEFLAIPFMDKDGVEEGDQGKLRRPHDHNRDYGGAAIYPEVRALEELVPAWSGGRLRIAMDLHCPYIRGGANEEIFFVHVKDEQKRLELDKFSQILEKEQRGGIPYAAANNMPYGEGWNTDEGGLEKSSAHWMSRLEGVRVATTLEFPYATAGGASVTASTARDFGRDLARAMVAYLQQLDPAKKP